MTFLSAVVLLFLVMDPLGNIPCFLVALKDAEPSRRGKIIAREMLIALFILALFLFAGPYILKLLQITEPSLTTAGGIVLFIIALKMIFPNRDKEGDATNNEPFIVPLAVPYVAGPSTIATVMLIMSKEPERWKEWILALVIAWFCSGLILIFSGKIKEILGEKPVVAIERLMGMILTAIAVEMIMNGIFRFIQFYKA
jgi:MarC family membrane protein